MLPAIIRQGPGGMANLVGSGGALLEGVMSQQTPWQPTLQQTQVLKNPVHVNAKSLRLLAGGAGGEAGLGRRWRLAFAFDATGPCEVQLHFGAPESELPPRSAAWSSTNVVYSEPALKREHSVDFEAPDAFASGVAAANFCIELRSLTLAASEGGGTATEWTLGRLLRRAESLPPGIELRQQRLQLPGLGMTATYELQEVFGAEAHGPAVLGQDCVICMSETRDTAVLPCRHMCLCGTCALTMRSRIQSGSYRCPICRERVSTLLQIRKPPEEVDIP